MNKKLLTLMMSAFLMPFYLQSATIEMGFENEQYNHSYDTSNVFMPYISSNFNPIKDSSFNISMKYMYQDEYKKKDADLEKDRFKTKRNRFEMYAKGYKWQSGAFTFAPEIGFRYEQWRINDNNTSKQDRRKLEIRLFPNMNYNVTQNLNVYFNGFIAPVFMETKQESRKDSSYVKGELGTNKYYGDYYQELQLIGLKYALADKNSVWASFYNEYKYQEHGAKYTRWQLRGGYNWRATENLNLNPYVRKDIYYKETNIESSSNNGLKRRKNETRIGTTANYKITADFSVLGEIYYQNAIVQNYKSIYSDDKNRMFYKLAIRYSF